MRILCIDPAATSGWALYERGDAVLGEIKPRGRTVDDKRGQLYAEGCCSDLLSELLPSREGVDLLVVEWPSMRPGFSSQAPLSVAAWCGAWQALVGAAENRTVSPGGWNHKGRGLAAARRLWKKHLEADPEKWPDALSALGILIHVLAQHDGQEIRSLDLEVERWA